jgi:hypothetical protein
MLLWLGEAPQVPADPHSWEGGQPPHVPPHPSSPHVLAVQSGLQFGGGPESAPLPEERVDALELALVDAPFEDAPLPEDDPVWLMADAPLLEDDPLPDEPSLCAPVPRPLPVIDVPEFVASDPAASRLPLDEHAPAARAAMAPNVMMTDFCISGRSPQYTR